MLARMSGCKIFRKVQDCMLDVLREFCRVTLVRFCLKD